MRHLEKPIREVFVDISNGVLTNLEIDAFIKQTTDKFKLPKLKRLIIDFEQFIKQERAYLIVYFDFMYGDREKFKKDGTVGYEETLNNIVDRYTIKFKNAPEVIHSDYDTSSQEITDFSPLLKEFTTEKTKDNYYQSLPTQSTSFNIIGGLAFGLGGNLFWSVAPILASTFVLKSMNSTKFKKTVGKLSGEYAGDDLDDTSEFSKGLRSFLKSPVYHFHLKLHTLYNLLKENFSSRSEYVSEPTEKYDSNVSPDNADKSSEISHADEIKKYQKDNYWELVHEYYHNGEEIWEDVYKRIETERASLGLHKRYKNFLSFKRNKSHYDKRKRKARNN